jgi:DNA adenine methylase
MQRAIRPIMRYPGAKWNCAEWIIQHLPPSHQYSEPYCGSAAVFFHLPWRPKHAVLNDLSGDIATLFRVIREDGDRLVALIEMTPWSREEYYLSYDACNDDIERARRFLVRTWQGHAGALDHRSGWRHGGVTSNIGVIAARTWQRLPVLVFQLTTLLRDAEIENRPALDLIQYYRDPKWLLYVDPPYPLSTRNGKMYQYEMTDTDHEALLGALDVHPGPVVLSGYACTLYDDRLKHWTRKTKIVQAEKGNTRTEVLWLNPICVERLGYGPLFAQEAL